MHTISDSELEALIGRQHEGFTLEQAFYSSPEIFALDVERIVAAKWLYVDHVSSIPAPGDYLLYEVAGESIIVVRDEQGELHAHYNVCRHRGSRICREPRGRVKRFVCPYHAWTYALDGRLEHARAMASGFAPPDYGLQPCAVRVLEGLIYVNLSPFRAPDFDLIAEHVRPYLAAHGLERARVAHREVYPTHANWKLVMENFRECYHCLPAHPEYTAVYAYVREKERGEGTTPATAAWAERVTAAGRFAGRRSWDEEYPAQPHAAFRRPVREGYRSLTVDGGPAAPLMGSFTEYDGGDTVVFVHPLHCVWAMNDHATIFRFTPVHATLTDVELTWLVREDAVEGRDYDRDRLVWLWHETTLADTRIIDDNQLGVNSRRYVPGPYSEHEDYAAQFTSWYLSQLRDGARSFPHAVAS